MNNILTLKAGFILNGKKEYTIKKVLGHGGCGILYYATCKVMDGNIEQIHEYAIKEYFDKDCCRRLGNGTVELTDDSEELKEIRDNFRAEATCLKNLKPHKNIVQVNEVFAENGTFYYVMEFLKGETLRQRVAGNLSEKEALKYIADIADALDYLHSEYINHLDVKPDNIMVVDEGDDMRAVLIDFGLSKYFNKNGKPKGKQGYDGASKGYAPKEQYDGIDEFSPQVDVYALAATLFFLLTGADPCSGKEITPKYIWNHLPDNVSKKTGEALVKAMNDDKDERTQSIEEFFHNLLGEKVNKPKGVPTDKITPKKKVQQLNDNNGYGIKKLLVYGIIAVAVVFCFVLIQRFIPTNTPVQKETPVPDTAMTDKENADVKSEGQVKQEKDVKEDMLTPIKSQQDGSQSNVSPKPVTVDVSEQAPTRMESSGTLDLGYAIWKGGIKNGKPDGVGKMTFRQSHRLDSETTANSGDVFDGTYTDGHIDGGKLHRTNGKVITIIGEN